MSRSSVTRSLLGRPLLYDAFQAIAGAQRGRRIIADSYIRAKPGDRVIDIGCGTAEILDHLPGVRYVGFDEHRDYVEAARERFGDRGQFFRDTVSAAALRELGKFDIALAIGVLHHVDDEGAIHLFELARSALTREGRLVTVDGCYVVPQSRVAKFLLSRDRGRFVRDEKGYLALAQRVFHNVVPTIRHDIARLPYTHLVMTCTNE